MIVLFLQNLSNFFRVFVLRIFHKNLVIYSKKTFQFLSLFKKTKLKVLIKTKNLFQIFFVHFKICSLYVSSCKRALKWSFKNEIKYSNTRKNLCFILICISFFSLFCLSSVSWHKTYHHFINAIHENLVKKKLKQNYHL